MFQHKINFSIIILCTIISIQNSANHSFYLPHKPSLRFHNNEPIKLRPGSYEKLIDRWQKLLNNSWNKFYRNMETEIGVSQETLDAYMNDESLANIYCTLKEKELSKFTKYCDEESIHPEVLTFIKRVLQKHCSKKNIKIILTPDINTITATFGSDKGTHYIICHSNIYTAEHIKHFYDSLSSNGSFYIEPSRAGNIRYIELSNFLTIGLIEAASHIQHQSNLMTFLVSNLKFSELRPTASTIQLCWHITETRGILESILQSKNPLETALFIGKTRKRTKKEQDLWKKLVNELADCYEPESLEFFKASAEEINSLYKG